MDENIGPKEITGTDSIWMCTCMSSKYWPICDGSHHTFGGDGPEEVILDPAKTYRLCQCFKTANRPFCDNSHLKK